MNAIQITTEQERAMAEEYEDDDGLLASLLGPTVIRRGSRLEVQLEGARERELVCEAEEKKARMDMVSAKEEVRERDEEGRIEVHPSLSSLLPSLSFSLSPSSPLSVSPPPPLSSSLPLPLLSLFPLPLSLRYRATRRRSIVT